MGGDDGAASRPKSKKRNGGFEFVLTPDQENTFTLGYNKARQDTTHTYGRSIAASSTTPAGTASKYRFEKDIFTLTHDGRYGDVIMNTYYQRDVSDKVQELTKKETVNTLNSQATYAFGSNVATVGAQYKTEKVENDTNGLLTALPGVGVRSADRWIAAVFAEMDWGITDKFSLTTGLRYNKDEFFGGHLSPRVYGVYRHTPEWTFKGGVSTGYKQPSLAQSTAGIGSTTGGGNWQAYAPNNRAISIGNPDLKPETSTSFELGTAFESVDQRLKTSVMFFHTDFKDKIAEDRYCESRNAANNNDYANWACSYGSNRYYFLSTNKNIDEAQMQGIELTLDYRFTPALKLSSSYTFTKSEQKSGANIGQPLTKQPRSMFNAVVDWQATAKLGAWLQTNYRSKTSDYLSRTSMADGTPGYALVDLGVVYRVNKTTRVKAGLYNVANKKITNETFGAVLDGRRLAVGMNVDF